MEVTAPHALPPPESPEVCVPPELTDGEFFHVFVSYSSSDQVWTHAVIQQLEDRGLKVCFHDRDFIPGRSIMDNMSDCIQQSQKVLLVLSQDFVKSRWCLLEADMSLFGDSLQRKPIVPVLLQKDLSIPLHLRHITYLEVSHPDFSEQLLRVLCLPNQQLQSSTLVPYQQPNTYNSNVLKVIISADEKIEGGSVWSIEIPQQLHLIIQEPGLYKEAIQIINRVNLKKVTLLHYFYILVALCFMIIILLIVQLFSKPTSVPPVPTYQTTGTAIAAGTSSEFLSAIIHNISPVLIGAAAAVQTILDMTEYKVVVKTGGALLLGFVFILAVMEYFSNPKPTLEQLEKASGEANTLLYQENILMGAWTSSEVCLVSVSLDACKQELMEQFPEKHHLFHEALLKNSSDYACLLFKNNFPFEMQNDTGHLNESVCFCQYVLHELCQVNDA